MMNMEQLKRFVALEKRKKELDVELKQINAELDDLEQPLLDQFLNDGIGLMRVDGRTVYIQRDVRANPVNERSEVVEALKQADLAAYVAENYNSKSLEAYVREVAKEVQAQFEQQEQENGQVKLLSEEDVIAALPVPLGRALKVSFVHSLRSRKS